MRASLSIKAAAIIGLGLAALIALGLIAYRGVDEYRKADREVRRLLAVQELLETVRLESERAEVAQLRYRLDKQPDSFEEFRQITQRVRRAIVQLGGLLRVQDQKDRLAALERASSARFGALAESLQPRRSGESAPESAAREHRAAADSAVAGIGDRERQMLRAQQERAESNAGLAFSATLLGAMLAVVLLLYLVLVIRRYEHDRRRVEAELRGAQQRLALALEGSNASLWDWYLGRNEIFLGAGWAKMLGASGQDTTTTPEKLLALVHPEDIDHVRSVVQRAVKGETPDYVEEHRVRRADGVWLWIHSRGKVVQRDTSGRAVRMAGTNQDISGQKQAELALREHDARLRLALDTAAMAGWEWDIASDRFAWQDSPERLVGPATAGGYSDLRDFVHAGDLVQFIRSLERAAKAGEPYRDEFRITRTDGRTAWVLARGRLERDADGKARRMIGVAQDISEIKEAEKALRASERQTRLITDAVPAVISYADANERVVFCNQTLARVLGLRPEEVVGRALGDLLGKDTYEYSRTFIERALRGERVQFERVQMTPRGLLDMAMTYVPHHGETGEVEGFYALGFDITELKRLDRMKSEFVSTVSHELRTPLTSIRGSLSVLAGGVAGVLPEKARGFIEIARTNCERLIRLINDILDMEKIESGKMNFQTTVLDLTELIEQAVKANQGYAEQRQVQLRVSAALPGAKLHADSDRLMQVLTNLISNACKFSPAGGSVDIALSRQGARIRVAVIDYGPGIPEEFRPRIFQKFSQADASNVKQKGGTGLGLSISKAIVEGLGGEIGFETGAQTGSTFYFYLPEWREPAPANSTASSARPCILICEDDADVARLLQFMVDKAGYDSDLAATADEARTRMRARRYAAITLDLRLPGEDGLSLLRTLRADPPGGEAVPVIVVSATAQEGRLQIGGENLGVVDWLSKPIDEERLLDDLRSATRAGARLRVLHVEDDADVRNIVATLARDIADFEAAETVSSARTKLGADRFDIVLLDLGLPDGSGWELLPLIDRLDPRPKVVIFSAQDAGETSAAAGYTYLVKSHTSEQQLVEAIGKAVKGSS